MSTHSLLTLVHLIGLAIGLGAATAKLVLLFRCRTDHAFVSTYLKIARPITRQIILGLMLLVLSGIGFLLLGYSFFPRLIVKIVLVAVIFVLGFSIDNVVEPKFRKLAPAPGQAASPEFLAIQKQYMALDLLAGLLFYAVLVMWVGF